MQKKSLALWGVLAAGAVLLAGQPVTAATPRGIRFAKGAGGHHKLANELGLSAEQEAQIKSIHKDAKQQRKALKADTTLSAKERHARLRAIREDSRQKVDALLTPDQRAKLAAIRAQHHQNHHAHKKA